MAADSYDLAIDSGADWFWSIRWRVGKSEKTSTPKDVTGYTAVLVVFRDYGDPPLLQLTTSNGGVDVIGTEGTFTFHANATQTTALPVGRKLRYEVKVTSPQQVVRKLARGYMTVAP